MILEADAKNAQSLSHETEGDIDSNCEEYGANDYPDEEEMVEYDAAHRNDRRRWMDQMAYVDYYNEDNTDPYGEDNHDYGAADQLLQVNDDYYAYYDWEDDLGDDRQDAMQHPYEYEDDE